MAFYRDDSAAAEEADGGDRGHETLVQIIKAVLLAICQSLTTSSALSPSFFAASSSGHGSKTLNLITERLTSATELFQNWVGAVSDCLQTGASMQEKEVCKCVFVQWTSDTQQREYMSVRVRVHGA